MTRKELYYELYALTNSHAKVERIFTLFGKLSPEPKERPQVPAYNPRKVRRVGTLVQRMKVTDEQRAAAKAIIEELGLL
jgi:hypothetical protein